MTHTAQDICCPAPRKKKFTDPGSGRQGISLPLNYPIYIFFFINITTAAIPFIKYILPMQDSNTNPFYSKESEVSEGLNDLPKITELEQGGS